MTSTLRPISLLTLLLAALLAWFPSHASAAAVAMVLDIQGQAGATANKQPVRIGIAVSLQEGTEVQLQDGGKLVLTHYASRAHLSFAGPARFVVSAKEVRSLAGAAPLVRQLPADTAQAAAGFRGRIVPAAMVMKGAAPAIVLSQPMAGESIVDDQLELAWTSSAPEVKFQLFEGKRLRGEKTVSAPPTRLADLASLAPGKSYRLIASAAGKEVTVPIKTLGVAQRQALAKLRPAVDAAVDQWVIYAMALEQAGAASNARAIWRRIGIQRQSAGDQVGELAE